MGLTVESYRFARIVTKILPPLTNQPLTNQPKRRLKHCLHARLSLTLALHNFLFVFRVSQLLYTASSNPWTKK